ncbi:MAG: NAD-dependent epimerase/dehydratase family protein [Candidatus Rokubacteria bacterium]|nr:NAD-dependent epimerase/dehydratase family protein [Candidatus Rokubacteria bacterium]
MKILVTGGAGFIGSHVVDRYVAEGHQVAVVDNLISGRREFVNPAARLYPMDIRSPRLAEVFEAERPGVVNHHAAQPDVRRSVTDPGLDASVNVLGSLNVLTCCRRFGVRRLIYASTGGAVYGDTAVLPTPEDHPTRPASPYGVSKLAAEHYLACGSALYGINTLVLRYANVYGPRQNPLGEAGVVAIFTYRLLRGEPAIVNGDGEQTRDYVYVGDVVEANLRALEQPEAAGVLNIGTGVETSVVQLFRSLQAAAGGRGEARHGPPKAGEQRRSVLDITLAKRLLGWTPRVTLEEGLRRTVEYFTKETAR